MTRTILVALVLGLAPASAHAQVPALQPAVIVTHGEAVLKRAPDRAFLTVAVETRDPKAADARKTNATVMASVQTALTTAGVQAGAIRTTGFSLAPEMEYVNGRTVPRGYLVRNQIEVRVDQLDRLGEVIDAANTVKGTGLSIVGPRFVLRDEEAAENEALRLAVQAAMARAESIASGARRTVGPILRIEESFRPRPEPIMMRQMASQAAAATETPVTPGEIEVRAEVTVTVEIR
jgi:uncharacterized protein YggE